MVETFLASADWFLPWITEHAPHAHWVIFALLMLAGLNVPISEDLMLIASGALASTIIPENTIKLFVAVFAGAYLSDWVAYWIGRRLGKPLRGVRWFSRLVRQQRLRRVEEYYHKYGVITLFVGRFIPFGVRNCLFMTAGMVRMNFVKFILADGLACLLSNSALFWLAYACGKNYRHLSSYLHIFDVVVFVAFLVFIISMLWYKRAKKQRNSPTPQDPATNDPVEGALVEVPVDEIDSEDRMRSAQ